MKKVLFMLVATCMLTGMANAWIAYNDCVFDESKVGTATDSQGQSIHYTSSNVTYYDISTGLHADSGELIDYATGAGTGVSVAITTSGGPVFQPSTGGTGGFDPIFGTDAANTFNGIVDMTGVTYYGGSPGWTVDYVFSGLDPQTEYTFAGSACRDGYSDRWSIFSIIGADTAVNASTAGVIDLGGGAVQFNTGGNRDEGYVARWAGITSGADGSITINATHAPVTSSDRKAYAFSVFSLQAVPEPMTLSLLGFGGLALLRRRRA